MRAHHTLFVRALFLPSISNVGFIQPKILNKCCIVVQLYIFNFPIQWNGLFIYFFIIFIRFTLVKYVKKFKNIIHTRIHILWWLAGIGGADADKLNLDHVRFGSFIYSLLFRCAPLRFGKSRPKITKCRHSLAHGNVKMQYGYEVESKIPFNGIIYCYMHDIIFHVAFSLMILFFHIYK